MNSPVCEQCGRDVKYWSNLIQDDDGDWRCSNCRMSNLKLKKSWNGQRCDVLGCGLTAKDHIDESRRIVSTHAWDERFTTKRDEKPKGDIEEVPFGASRFGTTFPGVR